MTRFQIGFVCIILIILIKVFSTGLEFGPETPESELSFKGFWRLTAIECSDGPLQGQGLALQQKLSQGLLTQSLHALAPSASVETKQWETQRKRKILCQSRSHSQWEWSAEDLLIVDAQQYSESFNDGICDPLIHLKKSRRYLYTLSQDQFKIYFNEHWMEQKEMDPCPEGVFTLVYGKQSK